MANVTNSTSCLKTHLASHDGPTSSIGFRVTFGVAVGVLLLFTILAGMFVCYIIYKHDMVKKKVWLYLLILALSDTGSCVFEIPFILAACVDENILKNRAVCNLSGVLLTFFTALSIYTLAAISLHRHYTISKPFEALGNTSRKDVMLSFLISVVMAAFLSISPVAGLSRYTYWPGRKWCISHSCKPKLDFIYLGVVITMGFIIPVCVIIFSSLRIVILVRRQQKIRVGSRRATQNEISREHRAMLKTTALIIGAFLVLMTPTMVYFVAGMTRVKVPLWFSHMTFFVLFLQCIINAAIYCFRHAVFKRELHTIFYRNAKKFKRSFRSVVQVRSITITLASESCDDSENQSSWKRRSASVQPADPQQFNNTPL